jgi:ABC-2 type transport system ATP-binding protein
MAVGLLTPTTGMIEVLGARPASGQSQLDRVGFVAQDTPLYARLSVGDHLRLGAKTSRRWDKDLAQERIDQLDLDLDQRAGSLSGGQQAQVALTLAASTPSPGESSSKDSWRSSPSRT